MVSKKRDMNDIRRYEEEIISLNRRIASEGETDYLMRRLKVCKDIVDVLGTEDLPDYGCYRDFNSIRPGMR